MKVIKIRVYSYLLYLLGVLLLSSILLFLFFASRNYYRATKEPYIVNDIYVLSSQPDSSIYFIKQSHNNYYFMNCIRVINRYEIKDRTEKYKLGDTVVIK